MTKRTFTDLELETLCNKNAMFKNTKDFTNKKLQEVLTDMEMPFAPTSNKEQLINLVAAKANEMRLNGEGVEPTAGTPRPEVGGSDDNATVEAGAGDTESERDGEQGSVEDDVPVETVTKEPERQESVQATIAKLVSVAVAKETKDIRSALAQVISQVGVLTSKMLDADTTHGSVDNLGKIENLKN